MFHNTTAAMGGDLMYSRREDVMNTSEFWASNSLASLLSFIQYCKTQAFSGTRPTMKIP